MSESVLNELIAENVGLREENKKLREESDLNYTFQIVSLGKPVKISGVLIAEGIWKGLKYSFEEMKKALSKFVGLSILVDHGKTKQFGSTEIGKITNVKADEILRSLVFEADITNDEAIELTTSKTLDAISIKGKFNEINTTIAPPEGKDYDPIEASLTSSPACEHCHIFNVELSNYIKQDKSLNNSISNIIPGDLNMSELEEIFIAEDEILVAPELTQDSDFEFEIMKEGAYTDELAKKKKAWKVEPGYYPKKVKKGLKKGDKIEPKYPYYKYEKYAKKKSLSDIDVLDILELDGSYRAFMKKCMGEGEDMKACAAKWKPSKKEEASLVEEEPEEEEDEFEELEELTEFKCPACDWTGKSLDEFKKHWNKEHKDSYGKYKYAKKLMKALLTKKELRNHVKKVLELSEVDTAEEPVTKETEEDIIKKYAGKPREIAELLLKSEGH